LVPGGINQTAKEIMTTNKIGGLLNPTTKAKGCWITSA
jgi:hypothetical protein